MSRESNAQSSFHFKKEQLKIPCKFLLQGQNFVPETCCVKLN